MNLWSDFDTTHYQQPTTIVYGRARRLTEQVVLSTLRAWLLHDYVAAYCRFLGATRIFRRCYWIDALGIDARANAETGTEGSTSTTRSNKGRKKEGAKAVPPALQTIVTLSQRLAQENKPITLYGLVLESGSSKRKEARATQKEPGTPTRMLHIPKESGIVRASWLEAATSLLEEINQSPAIFLLNPFGHTLFSYDDLAPLYQRTVPTDLCFLLSHKQIETRLHAALRSPEQASALTALLRTDLWKTLPSQEDKIREAVDGLIALFVTSMQRHFLFPVQRITLPIQTHPAVVEMVPYTCIFATRRQDSLFSMNDAICLYHRQVYERSHRGVLSEEWFVAQRQERLQENMQQLYQRILQQGRTQRVRHWPNLRQQVLLANFGQFTLHDYDQVMRDILLKGEARCDWRQKATGDEERPLPGNDDILIWKPEHESSYEKYKRHY